MRQKALIFPFLQRAVMLKKGSLARQSFSHCQCACMASSASMISSQWIFPFSFKIADRRFLSCSMAQERPMHTPYDRHSLSFARVRWNQKMAAEALCLSKVNGTVLFPLLLLLYKKSSYGISNKKAAESIIPPLFYSFRVLFCTYSSLPIKNASNSWELPW